MTHQLLCKHGHKLRPASTAERILVCPLCGSLVAQKVSAAPVSEIAATGVFRVSAPVPLDTGPVMTPTVIGEIAPPVDFGLTGEFLAPDAPISETRGYSNEASPSPVGQGDDDDLEFTVNYSPEANAESPHIEATDSHDFDDGHTGSAYQGRVDDLISKDTDTGDSVFCGTVHDVRVPDSVEKTPTEPAAPPVVSENQTAASPLTPSASSSPTSLFSSGDFLPGAPITSMSSVSSLASMSESDASSQSYMSIRTTAPMQTEIEVTSPPNLRGYTIIDELGRGGMGVVYRAYDEKQNRHVALKTLQRISPVGLQRFKQEFRSLADVSHPNLAGLYDLLSDGQSWCFTMEVLEAVDFLEYVWSQFDGLNRDPANQPLAHPRTRSERMTIGVLNRLYDGLKQLALGLHALHDAGVLHRDIKPSNILVTKDGRVVLVDFGLAAEIEDNATARGIQGTPEYMSPEQAGCKTMTPASDWYAVGVMLYEVLTGRLPIEGKPLQIIFKKQTSVPKTPKEFESSVPQELNDLCMALLDRDPARRPDVYTLLNRIGASDVAEALRASSRPRIVQVAELVGREAHLDALHDEFAHVIAGTARSVFVHGRSGMGKSVLIQTFLEEIQRLQQTVVLTGRCYEQESVPFKALDSLIDSLADHLGKLPAETVRQGIPEDSLPLVRLFPVMGKIPGMTDAGKPAIDNVDQQELRQRAMNALRDLLNWLSIQHPVVLYVDDLQWGDVDSAVLLADLLRPPRAPRVMMLGSYRSENIGTSPSLNALATAYTTGQHHPHRREIPVEALSEADATQLALLLLNRDDHESLRFASKIAQESGGWPFFVWELAQHVQDDPQIANQTLALDEVIWVRVCRLPEATRQLLELIAVAGRPIVAAEAYQALSVGATGQNLLIQLRTRNLIRSIESDNETTRVETYHDRIRESVVSHLDHETRRRYNHDFAETILQRSGLSVEEIWRYIKSAPPFEEPIASYRLERSQWQRVFDLSHFFSAAGESQKALPFAVIAAEQARKQNAFEVAEQQYRAALLGCDTAEPAVRFRILEGLADVLIVRGSYLAANEQLQAARSMVTDQDTLARIDGKLGRSYFKKGDMGDAGVYLEKALTALNEQPPGNLPSLLLRLSKEGVRQILHTFFPSRFVGRRSKSTEQGQRDLFRVRLFDDLTMVYWFSRSMEMVLWSHLRQMNLAERYPPTQEMGKTYSFHAITMSAIPLAARGIKYAERAHQISVDAGDLWGQGKARSFHTFSCIVLARFEEGLRTGAEAVRLLEQAGDVWEANMARMIASVPAFHLGDLRTAYRESRKAYEIGLETGDYSAVCIALLFWVPCAPQLVPKGAIQKELNRKREDPLSIAGAVYARGLELLLCEDKPAEAAQVLQDCLDRAKKRGLRNVCIFSAVTWKATALRIVTERTPEGPARRAALRAAKRSVRAALSITKSYLACRPHALREAGILAMFEGKAEKARTLFHESLKVAEHNKARYDHAKTTLALGKAGLKFGWPGAAEQVAQATALIAEMEDVTKS